VMNRLLKVIVKSSVFTIISPIGLAILFKIPLLYVLGVVVSVGTGIVILIFGIFEFLGSKSQKNR
jgi:hypothetical protein